MKKCITYDNISVVILLLLHKHNHFIAPNKACRTQDSDFINITRGFSLFKNQMGVAVAFVVGASVAFASDKNNKTLNYKFIFRDPNIQR